MKQFELKQGDEDNLAGKVVVYARGPQHGVCQETDDPSRPATYFALFASTAPSDLERVIQSEIQNPMVREVLSDLVEEFEMDCEDSPVELYALPLVLAAEGHALKLGADVLFVGEYRCMGETLEALRLGLSFYHLQLSRGMDGHLHADPTLVEAPSERLPTYREIGNNAFKEHLMRTYFVPLMSAAAMGNDRLREKISGELLSFFDGAPYTKDVQRFCAYVQSSGTSPSVSVVTAWINKIVAVQLQDFEQAQALNNELETLRAK